MQDDSTEKNTATPETIMELPPALAEFRQEMIEANRLGRFESVMMPIDMLIAHASSDGAHAGEGEPGEPDPRQPPPGPMLVINICHQHVAVFYNDKEGYVAQALISDPTVKPHTSLRFDFARRSDKGQLVSLFLAAFFIIRDTEMLTMRQSLVQKLMAVDQVLQAQHAHEVNAHNLSAEWGFGVLSIRQAMDRLLAAHGAAPPAPKSSIIIN